MSKCKQLPGKAVDTYLNHLTKVFNKFSGIAPPAAIVAVASPLGESLFSAFRQGLSAQIAKAVNKSCVGIEDARLAEVRHHTMHAEKLLKEADKAEEKKLKRDNHKASLTMMKHIADVTRRPYRNDDNWRKTTGGGREVDNDTCYICRRSGHWVRNYAEKGRRRGKNFGCCN